MWARIAAEKRLYALLRARGRLRLRKAIKEFYGTQFGKELDHETEIVVTSGANEGTFYLLIVRAVPPSRTSPSSISPISYPIRVALSSRACFECCFALHAESFVV